MSKGRSQSCCCPTGGSRSCSIGAVFPWVGEHESKQWSFVASALNHADDASYDPGTKRGRQAVAIQKRPSAPVPHTDAEPVARAQLVARRIPQFANSTWFAGVWYPVLVHAE